MGHPGIRAEPESRRHRRRIGVDDQRHGLHVAAGGIEVDVDRHQRGILRALRRLDPDEAGIGEDWPVVENVALQSGPDPLG